MWQSYLRPTSLAELRRLAAEHGASARLVAGGTDLVVELSRGVRPTETLIDLSGVAELRYVREDGRLDRARRAGDPRRRAGLGGLPRARLAAGPGLPGGRRAANPQPRHDRRQPGHRLAGQRHDPGAAGARGRRSVLASADGERVVPLGDFYPGFRQTALRPGEVVRAQCGCRRSRPAARPLRQARAAARAGDRGREPGRGAAARGRSSRRGADRARLRRANRDPGAAAEAYLAAGGWTPRPARARPSWPPATRARSTTCAARPPTGSRRCARCWPTHSAELAAGASPALDPAPVLLRGGGGVGQAPGRCPMARAPGQAPEGPDGEGARPAVGEGPDGERARLAVGEGPDGEGVRRGAGGSGAPGRRGRSGRDRVGRGRDRQRRGSRAPGDQDAARRAARGRRPDRHRGRCGGGGGGVLGERVEQRLGPGAREPRR